MRRLAFASLFLLVFLLGLAGGAWLFRTDLAETAAERWLAARGVPAQLTVARLELDRLVVTDVSLGSPPEASAEEIVLDLAWPRLGTPEVAGLFLDRARLSLDVSGEGPPLVALQPLYDKFEAAQTRASENVGDGLAPTAPQDSPADPALRPFPIEISDLTVFARTAVGPAELRLDGTARPDGTGWTAEMTLQGVTPVAVFGGRLEAEATAAGLARLQSDLRFAAEAQGLEGRLIADIADLQAAPSGRVSADLTAGPRTAALLAPLLPVPLAWEELRLSFDLDGRLPSLPAEGDWLARLERGDWSAAATLTGNDLSWPRHFAGAQLLLALDADHADGRLTILPAQTAELSIPRFETAFLDGLGLPDDLRTQLARGVGLRLLPLIEGEPLLTAERGPEATALRPALRIGLSAGPAAAVAAFRGQLNFDANTELQFIDLSEFNLSLSEWRVAGQGLTAAGVSGRLAGPPQDLIGALDITGEVASALPAVSIDRTSGRWPAHLQVDLLAPRLSLTGPLTLSALDLAGDGWALGSLAAQLDAELRVAAEGLDLTAPGNLALEGLRFGQRRVAALRAGLEENHARWAPGEAPSHRLAARWAPLELRIEQNGAALLEAGLEPGRWLIEGLLAPEGYQGSFAIDEAGLTLEEPPLRLEALRLSGPLPPQPGGALQLAGRLTPAAEPPLLPPLDLTGSVEPTDAGYDIALTGRALGGRVSAVARASLDPGAPRLRGTLTLAPLAFAPDDLQPVDVTPLLSELRNVDGSLAATLGLDWMAGGAETQAQVTLDRLRFSYGDSITVAGLAGRLDFDSLVPLQAAPPQTLTAERVEAGIPMTELTAEVGIATPASSGLPRLQIVSARARALGGWLTLQQGLIDPGVGREEAVLGFTDIDISELLALLDAPDIQATGRISGEIPVRLDGDTVTIAGGRLAAQAPGTLRLTSEAAKRALAAGGQSVDLMMQALEDFQYDELALTLDKPAEGTTLVTLKLFGRNPGVLEGQPFDVNVRLETDLAPLLLALSEALALTDEAVARLWRLQR